MTEGHHCEQCSGKVTPEERAAKEAAGLQKYGFYYHHVVGDQASPTGVNVHTHGFEASWGHPDVQLVLPLPLETAANILWAVADRVKAGEKFEAGKEYEKIIGRGLKVRLTRAKEDGREVLRIIFPSLEGGFERGKMGGPNLEKQWEGTEA